MTSSTIEKTHMLIMHNILPKQVSDRLIWCPGRSIGSGEGYEWVKGLAEQYQACKPSMFGHAGYSGNCAPVLNYCPCVHADITLRE